MQHKRQTYNNEINTGNGAMQNVKIVWSKVDTS